MAVRVEHTAVVCAHTQELYFRVRARVFVIRKPNLIHIELHTYCTEQSPS
jgi:hypothetical protein